MRDVDLGADAAERWLPNRCLSNSLDAGVGWCSLLKAARDDKRTLSVKLLRWGGWNLSWCWGPHESCPIFSCCRALSISCCASSYRRETSSLDDETWLLPVLLRCCKFFVWVVLENWWCVFFWITDLLMKPGCSCVFFGVTNLLRLQMTKNTWLMRFIERSVVFRRVHQFVATSALTTKTLQSLFTTTATMLRLTT